MNLIRNFKPDYSPYFGGGWGEDLCRSTLKKNILKVRGTKYEIVILEH